MTKCAYRNCKDSFKRVHGVGRNRHYCNNNCKQMEIYYRGKDKEMLETGKEPVYYNVTGDAL